MWIGPIIGTKSGIANFSVNNGSVYIESKLAIPKKCVFCDAEINYSTIIGFNIKDSTIGPVCLDCRKKLTKKHAMAEMI